MQHDPHDLFLAQWSIRANYHAIRRLKSSLTDPLLLDTLNRLDRMATDMHEAVKAAEAAAEDPALPLEVAHPVLGMRVGGGAHVG